MSNVISDIVNPFDIDVSVFDGIAKNSVLSVPQGTKSSYLSRSGWSKNFSSIVENVAQYSLSISSTGNGSASYDGTTIRGKTTSFTVDEGTSATITITPDDGYQIASVKVGSTDVTSKIVNNKYTISNITANTTVTVIFEEVAKYTVSFSIDGESYLDYSIAGAFYDKNNNLIESDGNSLTCEKGSYVRIELEGAIGSYYMREIIVNGKSLGVNEESYAQYPLDFGYTIENLSSDMVVVFRPRLFERYKTVYCSAVGPGNVKMYKNGTYVGTTVDNGSGYKLVSVVINHYAKDEIKLEFIPDEGCRLSNLNSGFYIPGEDGPGNINVKDNTYTVKYVSDEYSIYRMFEAVFEEIPVTTYSLKITASGNGSASYNGTTIRGKSTSFSVDEGTSATITFTPDDGYRIASVKVGSTDVTSRVSNNKIIINITANTNVTVTFEAIPVTTYTLSITASGNGSASYDGTTIRGKTTSFTVDEGTSATISFNPDNGYRIASVKVGSTDVTSKVSNNKYTISNITANTNVTVTFEAIPVTTYTLKITASGNGSASYDGTTVRGKTTSFTVDEGTSATITFTPDDGYRIASVKVGSTDVTSKVTSNKYTISNITANTNVTVTFEAIPVTTYTLKITASGNGSASYNGTTIRGKTTSFTVDEGTSATITFTPDAGYQIASVKVGSTDVTSSVSNNKYTISNITANTNVTVTFEAIPITTYTLKITASGNGSASYDGTTIRGKTTSFTVDEGTSATITFTPDAGYQIASVKVGSTDVTSKVTNNKYTISNIKANKTVSVTFEAIPPTVYSLSITSSGNGSAVYDGTSVKNMTATFSVVEGTDVTITFKPDNGYRVASVWMNNTYVTANVSNNKYTIKNFSTNTTVNVAFEEIPATTYSLSITSTGEGSVTYDGTAVSKGSQTFTVYEGASALLTFTPAEGHRLASLHVNNADVTANVTDSQYVIDNITSNTTVTASFEEIPPVTYSLVITVSGNGYVEYGNAAVRDKKSTFTVNEGTSAKLIFHADAGNHLASLKVGSKEYTSSVKNNQYTISKITAKKTVTVVFEEDPKEVSYEGLNYTVTSYPDKTLSLARGDYGQVLIVPATFKEQDITWNVTGMDTGALKDSKNLAAVIWDPAVAFTGEVSNPNLLLYVTAAEYAPSSIKNVVVNDVAASITLTDAASGNDFFCPREFTARRISYSHQYSMTTGIKESKGWETIALPFDVSRIEHSTKGAIVPFATWRSGSTQKPFWLYEYGSNGFTEASSIHANTPYVISMPNNEQYLADYRLNGTVTFSAENATVRKSDEVQTAASTSFTFVPNFARQEASASFYALNVNNSFVTNSSSTAGSMFVRNSRSVLPFEAYMTVQSANARGFIPVFEDVPTGISEIPFSSEGSDNDTWYTLDGQRLSGRPVKKGVYIRNGKAVVR